MHSCVNREEGERERETFSRSEKCTYQGLNSILFLHLLPQLLEACLQAVVERPQRLCDLLSVDADTFSQVRDLARRKQWCKEKLHQRNPGEMRGWPHACSSSIRGMCYCPATYIQLTAYDLWRLGCASSAQAVIVYRREWAHKEEISPQLCPGGGHIY